MDLRALQRAFQDRVLSYEETIEPHLTGNGKADFPERLGAYVGGYRLRLVEALGTTYPALRRALGNDEFDAEMRRYIDSTPSQHYSVRHYGAAVARRLVESFPGEQGIVMSELAAWEWLLADVFDAPDDEPLDVSALTTVPAAAWPDMTFVARACMRRFETRTNAVEWWRAANGMRDKPAGYNLSEPSQWLLWRRGVKTQFRSLDPTEAILWDEAASGTTFGVLCERVAELVDESDVAIRAASFLKGWLTEELIADCAWPDRTG